VVPVIYVYSLTYTVSQKKTQHLLRNVGFRGGMAPWPLGSAP